MQSPIRHQGHYGHNRSMSSPRRRSPFREGHMRVFRLALILVFSCIVFSTPALAQEASVIGTVTDDTKAVLPGATVTATGLETGVQTVGVADANGQYRLRLPAGTYKLLAELSGFGPVLVPKVELLVGQ